MPWMRHLLAASLVLASTAGAIVAEAGRRLPVAVVVLPGPGADAATARDVRRALLKAFALDRDVLPLDPLKIASSSALTVDANTEALLSHGIEALQKRRYQAAARELRRAVELLEQRLSQVPRALLAQATVHQAAALLGAGRRAQAARVLTGLLIWRPGHKLELAAPAPAGWNELCDHVRAVVRQTASSSVDISSIPPRAEAFVDGRRMGPTPVTATNLSLGTHYLTLQLEGYQRLVVPFEVREVRRTVSVTLEPDPSTAGLVAALEQMKQELGAQRLEGVSSSLARVGVSRGLFVLVTAAPGMLDLFGYLYSRRGRLVGQSTVRTAAPPRPDELAPLALWRPAAVTVVPAGTTVAGSSSRQGRPWYRKWWVWTLVGASVTAGVALPLALGRPGGESDERFQVQW